MASRLAVSFLFWCAACSAGCGDGTVTRSGPFHPALPEVRGPIAGSEGRTLFVLQQEFTFVDSTGRKWTAPIETLTDGASIPKAFLSFFGSTTDIRFLPAAVIHDAYCAEDNQGRPSYHGRGWREVHRMFHEALLASNVDPKTAKLMYAAVYFRGPRWPDPSWKDRPLVGKRPGGEPAGGGTPVGGSGPASPSDSVEPAWRNPYVELSPAIESVVEEKFRHCEKLIMEKNLSLDEIDHWMDAADASMLRTADSKSKLEPR